MENILIRYFREASGLVPETIAANLGISVNEYYEMETGQLLMTKKQAYQLGKLFRVNGSYIYEAVQQLDLLMAINEIIKIRKEKIAELETQVLNLKATAHENK
jgi:DNA-binding XRE family transcriptional regulator